MKPYRYLSIAIVALSAALPALAFADVGNLVNTTLSSTSPFSDSGYTLFQQPVATSTDTLTGTLTGVTLSIQYAGASASSNGVEVILTASTDPGNQDQTQGCLGYFAVPNGTGTLNISDQPLSDFSFGGGCSSFTPGEYVTLAVDFLTSGTFQIAGAASQQGGFYQSFWGNSENLQPTDPNIYTAFFVLSGLTTSGGGNVSYSTQISAVTPVGGSTIASSTAATFGATGYIAASDYVPGTTLTITYAPTNAADVVSALPNAFTTTLTFPIYAYGAFDFSTTSPAVSDGDYNMSAVLQGPNIPYFYGLFYNPGSVLTSTSTEFTVNNQIGIDEFTASTTALIESAYASSTISLASCSSFVGFNLGDCLNVLFVPQPAAINAVLSQFRGQLLSYFPWGYVTRFFTILSSNGTSTLPSATAVIAMPYSDGSASDTQSFTVDPTATLAAASAALDGIDANGTDLNWQAVLEPYVQLFIGITLLFIIVFDLIGTAHHHRNHAR